MYDHVMIDLETMGTSPDCVVLSLGAVPFSLTDKTVGHNHGIKMYPNKEEQIQGGRSCDDDTVKWWERQEEAARMDWEKGQKVAHSVEEFEMRFKAWLNGACCAMKYRFVWSHGSCFDIIILENLFRNGVPWKFWNIRDTRTLFHLKDVKPNRTEGVHHDPLDDAISQANAVIRAWHKS